MDDLEDVLAKLAASGPSARLQAVYEVVSQK